MEPWASVRAVNPWVGTEGEVGGLASSITPELVNLQERVRDLKAALSKKSARGFESFRGCKPVGKAPARPRVQFFAKAPLPPARIASRGSLSKTRERCLGTGWRRSPNSWKARREAQHWKTPRECRRDQDGPGDADVGGPRKWPPPSGGRSPHATLQSAPAAASDPSAQIE